MATLAEELILRLELWAREQGGREDAALLIEHEWANMPPKRKTILVDGVTYSTDPKSHMWSDEQVSLLKGVTNHYEVMKVAHKLGKSYQAVYEKLKRIKNKTPDL